MTRLKWDEPGTKKYISGVDRGVVFPPDKDGVAWPGLISVDNSEDISQSFVQYIDGQQVLTQMAIGSFSAKIETYHTPDVVFDLNGMSSNLYTSQTKTPFGFTYRTFLDEDNYQIHLVYQALIRLSNKTYSTTDGSPSPSTLSWDISAKPSKLDGYVASAHFVVDSSLVHSWTLKEFEDILYGTIDRESRLPSVDELLDIFESGVVLKITDHGDGTWTAEGPNEAIQMIDATTFRITWPSAIYINTSNYQISSL